MKSALARRSLPYSDCATVSHEQRCILDRRRLGAPMSQLRPASTGEVVSSRSCP